MRRPHENYVQQLENKHRMRRPHEKDVFAKRSANRFFAKKHKTHVFFCTCDLRGDHFFLFLFGEVLTPIPFPVSKRSIVLNFVLVFWASVGHGIFTPPAPVPEVFGATVFRL